MYTTTVKARIHVDKIILCLKMLKVANRDYCKNVEISLPRY